MGRKYFLVFLLSFIFLLPFNAESAPPMPARIGGTVTINGTPLTQNTDAGYTFKVTKQDGTAYVPAAEDLDGLNASNWYIIDIPLFDANDQPGGANQGETAIMHVYNNGNELWVTDLDDPDNLDNGEFLVGESGSTNRIDLVAVTCNPDGDGSDCDDNNPCTDDSCDPNTGCQNTANTDSCEDGNFCTVNDICENKVCKSGDARVCADQNPDNVCDTGWCDEEADACVQVVDNDGGSCEDGLYCTVNDTCVNKVCEGGAARVCTDQNPDNVCDTGWCDEDANTCAQVADNDGGSCEDGLYCTVNDTCVNKVCESGDARICTDQNPDNVCDTGWCDEDANTCAQVADNDGGTCEDGLYCTTNDSCVNKVCVSGDARVCTDQNPDNVCDTGLCDEEADACVQVADNEGSSCDDGEFCTDSDQCTNGTCSGEPAHNGEDCDDSNTCTVGDKCENGICSGDALPDESDCSDGNACTGNDKCINVTCVGDPIDEGGDCEDGLYCNINTICTSGECVGGEPNTCDDGEFCTEDSCDEDSDTCVNDSVPMNESGCDDGLFCTVGDVCADGTCDGSERDCGDSNACTNDSCDDIAGLCVNANNTNSCDDGKWCTVGDVCAGGACSGIARDCSEQPVDVVCTDDSCNEASDTCVNEPNYLNCDDGDLCTDDICDSDTDCSYEPISDCHNINTPVGEGVTIPDPAIPGLDITVWFEEVTSAGTTTIQDNSVNPGEFPGKFSLCGNYFDITLTGVAYDGRIEICAPYDPNLVPQGDNVSLMHFVNGEWEPALDQTVGVNQICGFVTTLSPFAPAASPCADADGDGFFDQDGCGTAVDCDDKDSSVNPGAAEVCEDGKDNDCSGGDASCGGGPGTQAAAPTEDTDDGGGGCSVVSANHNMSTGSAMANTLVLLLPLIIFGIRRKRGKDKDRFCN